MLRALLLDFDGVIKESLDIKTEAFAALFAPWGETAMARARAHHLANGGMSRFEKIPLYLREYCGVAPDADLVARLVADFADRVTDAVIASPYVPGARGLIERSAAAGLVLAVVSGTPEDEMRDIVERAGLAPFFARVYGSPRGKRELLELAFADLGVTPGECLFVGDSINDFRPALALGVPFVGRVRPGTDDPFPPDVVRVADLAGIDPVAIHARALARV